MTSYIPLSYWDIGLASVFVLINAGASIALELGIHQRILTAAIRMVVQLFLIGLVLNALFAAMSPLWTGIAVFGMILFAGGEIAARQERSLSGIWSYGLGTGCIMASSLLVTIFALTAALRPHPWYDPKYAIPLLGMILGNGMTGVALGLQGITAGAVMGRGSIEAQLMLGASRSRAMGPVIRQSLRNALMPIINSMSVTGIVALPGMMTGQILGGVAPVEAVKYQIFIMFLIAGGTGIGATAAVMGGAYRMTDARHRLRLDRLVSGRE